MREDERLSSLIGDIYDAALDASLWVAVLRKARDFVGGQAAALFWKDAAGKSGNAYYEDGGIEPHYSRLYFEKYVKLDPATTSHYFAEIGKPVATADIIPYDEFLDTRMYKEWARPQGLVDFVSALLDKSVTSAAMFGVFRHERHGVADDEMRRRMRLIIPHVRRAVLIGRVIDTSGSRDVRRRARRPQRRHAARGCERSHRARQYRRSCHACCRRFPACGRWAAGGKRSSVGRDLA